MSQDYPTTVFLELSRPCNLRCKQCLIHTFQNHSYELSQMERASLIEQVSLWKAKPRIVLTGGELFLDKERLYNTAIIARNLSVPLTMNTNGTLIKESDINRLPTSGIQTIVVSIDSDLESVHDELRGVKGTFRRASKTVRELSKARDIYEADFSILTSTILGSHNIERINEMVDYFQGIGADSMLFQAIQPTFGDEYRADWWKTSSLFPKDQNQIDRAIDLLEHLKRDGRPLFQTIEQLEDMRDYFHNPDFLFPSRCGSADRNLMIESDGNVSLCFHMDRIGLRPIGNVRVSSLIDIYNSSNAGLAREKMHKCLLGCGTMICHAR